MKKYWKSLEEYNDLPAVDEETIEMEQKSSVLELLDDDISNQTSSRRDFLKIFGYSVTSAAILASCERPVQKAIPYIIQPEGVIPGKAIHYASSFFDGHEYCSILVKTRDGRPIKIEGNNLSPFNGEGTTARIQASVLSLYDDARLKEPGLNNLPAVWDEIDELIIKNLSKTPDDRRKTVLLTSSIISPATVKLIKEFGNQFSNFKWVQYDAVSYSAILEANQKSFGSAVIPDYNFQNTDLVVSFNADFLGTWLSPVHFIPRYISRRKLDQGQKDMLRHIQFESGMSLTGSNADLRKRIKPSEEKIILANLYNKLAEKTGAGVFPVPACKEDLSSLTDELWNSRGRSVVVSGTNDVDIQLIVNGINTVLGNYGNCIDLVNHLNIAAGMDSEIEILVNELNAGDIKTLLIYNVNPVYDLPQSEKFLSGIKKAELTINMCVAQNETVGKCMYECPVHHYLESWDDAEIIPGQLSLTQPCIHPIFNTRSFQDSLLKWSGKSVSYHEYLKSYWEKEYFPYSNQSVFKNFWNTSLQNGVFSYKISIDKSLKFNTAVLPAAMSFVKTPELNGYEIVFNESVALGTGMHANNPWLMELPDPIARLCWDNVAAISLPDSEKLGIQTGDLIKIGELFTIPAFIQPGQAEGTISIALGYGHTNSGKVSNNVGLNVYPFISYINGSRRYGVVTDKLVNTLNKAQLALTQVHYSMEGRAIVRETSLDKYKEDPGSGNELHREYEAKHRTLYPEAKYDGFHWGLAVDMNSCVGCNACVIACQAENNIPVIGKEEVRKRRIMHWIKIDRYYSGTPVDPKVHYQAVMCQHCDNAPCENVCPVSATNHSNEGLNQMTYNRCIGTKYCINNCPYKVRRFNWYRYTGNKAFDFNAVSDLGKLVLNPDVTVRERGVVEKCTFCVQRIQEKKLEAKLENRALEDGEIKTACMQSCPSNALIFGNLNDKNSKVSKLFEDPRRYHLLEELHTLPSVGYLTRVWNEKNDDKLKA